MRQKLMEFLKEINNDFPTSLSTKIDFEEFIEKIILNAQLIIRYSGDKIIGLLIFYCNDFQNKTAYCSLVGVDSNFRGKGIATDMILEMIDKVKKSSMESIYIHTENLKAMSLYIKLGFKLLEINDNKRYKLVYHFN